MSEKRTQDGPETPNLSTMNQSSSITENPTPTPNPPTTTTAQTTTPGMTATTATPTTTSPPPQASTNSPPQTLNSKLNASDRYWKFKTALQAFLIIFDIIGIGCMGWAVATDPTVYDSSFILFSSVIPLSVSCVWSSICVVVFLVRKQSVHPGARVAVDLILWLTFIFAVLVSMYSVMNSIRWGESGQMGGYELADNGTWVWDSRLNGGSSTERACEEQENTSGFATCAEQDAYVNQLWREKLHRVNVEMTGLACQFLGIVLHFTLFVWACVDTHHRNKGGATKDAEKIAAEIVMKMVKDGAIVQPPQQPHARPPMPQSVFHPQQGVHANQHMYPQNTYPPPQIYPQQTPPQQANPQQMTLQPAGPSNPKAGVARYA